MVSCYEYLLIYIGHIGKFGTKHKRSTELAKYADRRVPKIKVKTKDSTAEDSKQQKGSVEIKHLKQKDQKIQSASR